MPIVRDIPVRAVRERDGKIKRLLQSPDAELVSLVTGLVNLTEAEKTAVDLCLRRGMTQEQAAETLDCSVEAIQKWSRSAKNKLWAVWSGRWWIRKLMEE